MRILKIVESVLFVISVTYLFINWKIGISIIMLTGIIRVIPLGPDPLLLVLSGYLWIAGIVYLFINWKIGVLLILLGFILSKFRLWGKRIVEEESNV